MIDKVMTTSRVTEVDAVSMRMLTAYQTTNRTTDSHLSAMFTMLESQSAALTAAINRSKAESDLKEKDEARDTQLRALYFLIMGFMNYPDTDIQQYAQKVNNLLEKYGLCIIGESYATESSLIASLLNDLANEELQTAIASLPGYATVITALQTAQQAFENARIAYEQKKAQESTRSNATQLKVEVLGLINKKIVVYLRAMEVVDAENYGAFARTIGTIIADNNEVVKKRHKKAAPKAE